ncbi:hypothetical protein Z517_02161 [Fonsecaea pedrosoi CBS 271.37]|uniref:Uncharacterized protein n=1 Tax=Fonsecaea pedrosoi CBS 271.37 TaxID=1442368 RepID=A0A0D2GPL4_9EURO|nr:uncharacterized protein Z517_02161 [Fonsecaea pedrosoi CBS 271.37]KIW82918.1 hypothetical protein Z517_02161 [Fonsecaea pedrosoi CBS 271.37]
MASRDHILQLKKTTPPTTKQPTFISIRDAPEASHFGMNEVACLVFGAQRFHVTSGLNACFGVFLVSLTATVSAHIPPRPDLQDPDPQAGDKNLLAKMHEFASLYKANEKHFTSYHVALICARFEGKAALPDKRDFIVKCLKRFNVDFPIQYYDVKFAREPRSEKHGTAFVDGGRMDGAVLYLEDDPVLRVHKSSDRGSQSATPQETHHANPIFPRPCTIPPDAHATDQPSDQGKEGRVVEGPSGSASIRAEELEKATIKGNTVLACKKVPVVYRLMMLLITRRGEDMGVDSRSLSFFRRLELPISSVT